MSASTRLGILIPCRNEATVVARVVASLARAGWPDAGEGSRHRLVVVDDGSDDGTAERAAEALADAFTGRGDVELSVVPNDVRPGKPGAIRSGLRVLGQTVDVVVLTDADVVVGEASLVELAKAFERDADLALACGAQRFEPAATAYDRITALVRRLESRFGRLFSVHGQLLAWRASLGIAPTLGVAADDLDLMLQVRARVEAPRGVRLVASAPFHEVKTPPGPEADEQALRRARAYVQVVRASTPGRLGPLSRAQWLLYRHAPTSAPWLLPGAVVAVLASAWLAGGATWLAALAVPTAVFLALPPGRRLVRLLATIREAVRLESRGPLAEQWEMARR